ncbi:MAG: flavodoxin family protein [Anaerolineales bacterium]|nr:flavodoxin family protein [Anaerolineales bacterium]
MGNVLVQYYSETGHTREMAELVALGASQVNGIDVRLKSIDQSTLEDVDWCHGIALGAPTHLGSIPWKLKKWWDEAVETQWGKIDGKFGCAFSSAGGLGGGPELTCMGLLTILMNYGFLVFGVTDYVAPMMTLHYGAALPGHPKTQTEKDLCIRLGVRLAEWVSCYVDRNDSYHPLKASYKRSP